MDKNNRHADIGDTRRVKMSEARRELGRLTERVASHPLEVVQLDCRDSPRALLVSQERFGPLLQALQPASGTADVTAGLRWFVLERWLAGAPDHLKAPQEQELQTLAPEELFLLLREDPDEPIDLDDLPDRLRGVLSRLRKRYAVARALREAEEAGLYESSEHLSGHDME